MVYEGLSFTSGDGGDEMGEVKWGRGWGENIRRKIVLKKYEI
jgi:hypothetical protein